LSVIPCFSYPWLIALFLRSKLADPAAEHK
jgi:hypothetical protein